MEQEEPVMLPDAIPEDLKQVAKNWNSIVFQTSGLVKAMLPTAKPSIGVDNNLLLVFSDKVEHDTINKDDHLEEIAGVIEKHIGKRVKIQTKLVNQGDDTKNSLVDLTKIIKNIEIEYED
jgi:DNA polymerase-3 subunit gamma/tau